VALLTARFDCDAQLRKASENQPALRWGSEGEGVAILQQALVDLGFQMPISTENGRALPDGIFGAETARAVTSFQRTQGLQQDGVAGKKTLNRLELVLIAQAEIDRTVLVAQMQGPPSTRPITSGSPTRGA
jgi:peptidoglycan hydrolase-like protein with peptidoglycan-binding domain